MVWQQLIENCFKRIRPKIRVSWPLRAQSVQICLFICFVINFVPNLFDSFVLISPVSAQWIVSLEQCVNFVIIAVQFPHHAIICVSSQFRQEFPPCGSNEHKCCNMGKITQASSSTKLYDKQLHPESKFYITSVSKASTYGFISTWPRSWAVNLKGWGYSHIEAIIMGYVLLWRVWLSVSFTWDRV